MSTGSGCISFSNSIANKRSYRNRLVALLLHVDAACRFPVPALRLPRDVLFVRHSSDSLVTRQPPDHRRAVEDRSHTALDHVQTRARCRIDDNSGPRCRGRRQRSRGDRGGGAAGRLSESAGPAGRASGDRRATVSRAPIRDHVEVVPSGSVISSIRSRLRPCRIMPDSSIVVGARTVAEGRSRASSRRAARARCWRLRCSS